MSKYYLIKTDTNDKIDIELYLDKLSKGYVELADEDLHNMLNGDKYENEVIATYPPQYIEKPWLEKIRNIIGIEYTYSIVKQDNFGRQQWKDAEEEIWKKSK